MSWIKTYGMFTAFAEIDGLTLSHFTSETKCGAVQTAFKLNPSASDYVPRHVFTNTVIREVEEGALLHLDDAPE